MRKLRIGMPSPAMGVALLALCVSAVGTAFAGPIAEISGLSKKDKRVVRKISNRISNKRITKRASKLSVRRAQVSDTATTATSAGRATSAASATNADLLDGLDSSAFLGKEQLFVQSSAADKAFSEHVLIDFPDLGFELRTDGALSVGYAATAPGDYEWSGYVNGIKVFNAVGPSEGVVATVALEKEAGVISSFAMVRKNPDGSNVGIATAECFHMPGAAKEIACLGRSASSG